MVVFARGTGAWYLWVLLDFDVWDLFMWIIANIYLCTREVSLVFLWAYLREIVY